MGERIPQPCFNADSSLDDQVNIRDMLGDDATTTRNHRVQSFGKFAIMQGYAVGLGLGVCRKNGHGSRRAGMGRGRGHGGPGGLQAAANVAKHRSCTGGRTRITRTLQGFLNFATFSYLRLARATVRRSTDFEGRMQCSSSRFKDFWRLACQSLLQEGQCRCLGLVGVVGNVKVNVDPLRQHE